MKPGGQRIRERVKDGSLDPREAMSWLRLRSEDGHALSPRIMAWLRRRAK